MRLVTVSRGTVAGRSNQTTQEPRVQPFGQKGIMMSVEWMHATQLDIDGSGKPGSYESEDGVEENEVAAVRIVSRYNGDGIIVQGRPEQLVGMARELLRVAEAVLEQVNEDPKLLAMYGEVRRIEVPA